MSRRTRCWRHFFNKFMRILSKIPKRGCPLRGCSRLRDATGAQMRTFRNSEKSTKANVSSSSKPCGNSSPKNSKTTRTNSPNSTNSLTLSTLHTKKNKKTIQNRTLIHPKPGPTTNKTKPGPTPPISAKTTLLKNTTNQNHYQENP